MMLEIGETYQVIEKVEHNVCPTFEYPIIRHIYILLRSTYQRGNLVSTLILTQTSAQNI